MIMSHLGFYCRMIYKSRRDGQESGKILWFDKLTKSGKIMNYENWGGMRGAVGSLPMISFWSVSFGVAGFILYVLVALCRLA
jgi:hypothetical protein